MQALDLQSKILCSSPLPLPVVSEPRPKKQLDCSQINPWLIRVKQINPAAINLASTGHNVLSSRSTKNTFAYYTDKEQVGLNPLCILSSQTKAQPHFHPLPLLLFL